ncbi:MAG: ABC transporter ATP-binding protein [Rhodospirillales bacterium]|jgi:branched-chain amino acid transport system ATP-binding protein|uniref:ABC transporter ATP-binding protein n=1 Tax=Hwanghaeella sp. 1Z406 TaxID=3402811 RepID=UPI000C8992DC|nr:ABC transporter ATP-binding protein [Rhodospirillales bacterium]|tara:strand:+ start:12043 stop:12789 length:747 start_codon:yes stop_codon:yes gene_type:complete
MSLLSIKSLSKNFGGLQALNQITLDVAEGSVHGLMGANGAGKTTLFSIIAGNQRASSGAILFAGQTISGLRPDQVCKRGISRTFQIVRPFAGLTVRENVEIAILYGRQAPPKVSEAAALAQDILADIGLDAVSDQPAGSLTLSGRKRLEVARALGTEPRLLMLDEVMAGLTPVEVTDMIASLRRVKDGHGLTILIIEHVMSALTDMSDTITVLHHGEKIAQGTPQQIADNAAVQEAYFGIAEPLEAPV